MEVSKDSFKSSPKMQETTLGQQNKRDRIDEGWMPNAFARYEYQKRLLEGMPVLGGGASDDFMGNPARYEPVPQHMEEDFPVSIRERARGGRQG
jgi:hypothetical protein